MDKLRRRRWKKPRVHSSSNHPCTRQDAELEQEVDSFLNWGVTRSREPQWRFKVNDGDSDSGVKDSLAEQSNPKSIANQRKTNVIVKQNASLPALLHFREIGFSRVEKKFGNRRASSSATWKSRLLHQPFSASVAPPTMHSSSSASQSQWNALQFSTPTYYGKYNNINSFGDDATISCTGMGAMDNVNDAIIHLHRHSWRPYTRHKIPFAKLRTPISDAILALDRSGGYMIGIGSGDENASGMHSSKETLPHLSIKFYGVPSPARLKQAQDADSDALGSAIVSPLVHVIPLLSKKSRSVGNGISPSPSSILDCNEYASPVAEIPIQILLSDGGSIGVAFLRHSTVVAWSSNSAPTFSKSQDEDTLGTIVIFESPIGSKCSDGSRMSKSFRLNNVSIGWWSSFTIRNALWPATVVPVRDDVKLMNSHSNDTDTVTNLFYHIRTVLSAYVLFNDEDDGFRITWITMDGKDASSCSTSNNSTFPYVPNKIRPSRNDIVTQSEGDIWEECWSDRSTGCVFAPDDETVPRHGSLHVAFELYLHIDALLSEIISRRQLSFFRHSPYHNERVLFMPEFFYNIVSASIDSLKVVVVIVFSNKEKMIMQSQKRVPSALGVYVEVILADQSYDELKWVQHPSCNDASSMKQWCNSLALNWRMMQSRVGVFCLDNSEIDQQMESWVCCTHECNVNEDLSDDRNVPLWREYVDRRNVFKMQGLSAAPPKDVSMSSLYPHCDVITNRAVHNAIPVKRITSRDSAVELIYG